MTRTRKARKAPPMPADVEGTLGPIPPLMDAQDAEIAQLEMAEAQEARGEAAIDDSVVEADIHRAKSVVPNSYKRSYAERAVIAGHTTRAAKRCNGDWLARELEAECVQDGKNFDMARFLQILEANGIADPLVRWPNRNNGWEGRLRMSGAIVLRGIVRKSGTLVTPDTTIQAPESFTK